MQSSQCASYPLSELLPSEKTRSVKVPDLWAGSMSELVFLLYCNTMKMEV